MAQRRLYNYLTYPQLDLSGGVQTVTSHLLRKRNEVKAAINAAFNIKIGSAVRRPGYEQVGTTIEPNNNSLGAFVYRYGQYNKILTAINNSDNSFATIRYLDVGGYWTNLLTQLPANCRFNFINDLDQLYIAGKVPGSAIYMPLTNVDKTLTPSTTRNLTGAPVAARFIAEYGGVLLAIGCQVNVNGQLITYPDRAYLSSPPLGAITFINSDQSSILNSLRVDSVQYLKAGMSVDIYRAGTNALVTTIPIVSIDKNGKRFTFNPTSLTIYDNDEVWLSGTKGQLNRFWNTDYPTTETSDFIRIPPGQEEAPAFTGYGGNNNRLFLYTKNSVMKYDGAQLITVSDTIGCVSQETIQNLGPQLVWLHSTGVWGYNDNSGALTLLSRAMDPYIKAINQANLPYSSAGVVGKAYKLSLGELLPLDSVTTSTSTSSTTTSTTSTSYSSTSTSSTSTSTTQPPTTTSVSSTSSSTSSTSTSSTSSSTTSQSTSISSTSSSTSYSSTSTSTVASSKKVVRLVYDYDMNAWWTEQHKREIRFQFNHSMNGYVKPYFTDETGRLFRDETGNLDHHDTIPMSIEWGRNNFGTDQLKLYFTLLIDSENARGGVMQYARDLGAFETLGQLTDPQTKISIGTAEDLKEGHDINFKFVHNDGGDPPAINGQSTYFKIQELIVNEL